MAAGRLRRQAPVATLMLVAALAWAVLWGWSSSPWSRYLEHGDWLSPLPFAEICRAVPAGDVLVPAVLHSAAWVLMIAAMMLPTIAPLLDRFARVVAQRTDRGRLMVAIAGGYLVAWTLFGLLAHGADRLVLEGLARVPGAARHGWLLGAATLTVAGLFQFSSLKYRCLERCRAPTGFIAARWHGRSALREAMALGMHHGMFCIGCCWALMMLMFVVGTGNIGWMLALGAVMAIEKNVRWGRRLSAPLGAVLIATAAGIVVARGFPV